MTEVSKKKTVSSRGMQFNTGSGPTLQPIDIGHKDYVGLLDPDSAFWSLIEKSKLGEALCDSEFLNQYREKLAAFMREMDTLRCGL